MKHLKHVVFAMVLSGCAGTIVMAPKIKKQFVNYTQNQIQDASIGDPIIDIESAAVLDAYVSLMDYQTPTVGIQQSKQIFIKKGDRFTASANLLGDTNSVLIREEGPEPKFMAIHIDKNGFVKQGWVLADGTLPVQGTWTKEKLFEISNMPTKSTSIFKSQIIYSGLIDNNVKAVYREFSEDLARPAFSQELQYNLDESKVISYKTVKIEVISATNSKIEYKVISDEGLPWVPK